MAKTDPRHPHRNPAPLPKPNPWRTRAEEFGRTRGAFPAASALLLIPCFWQSRLQAGDLSSHIYNTWLAQLIGQGQAPGLTIAHQSTNLLFDCLLGLLFGMMGSAAAQKVAVALVVLAFVWGAFAFVSVTQRTRAWHMLPVIAIMAYGWVFHMGFFNFYLSLGLSFLAMALCWEWNLRYCLAALPVVALAYVAHALPVAWAISLLAYHWVAGRISGRGRLYLLAASMVAMAVVRTVMVSRWTTRWFPAQVLSATGLDQVWVFDGKYQWIMVLFAIVGAVFLLRRVRASDQSRVGLEICVLTAFGIAIFPTAVLIPGYKHALAFIAERMSLALGICFCAAVAGVPVRAYERYGMALVTMIFFAFLFHDELQLNAFEDRMERLASQLPAGQRVISAINAGNLRVNALTHMIDRVCIGHCYSYANYEPSTAQFRIRATGENSIVAATYEDSWGMQSGSYVVKQRDLPLYELNLDSNGRMVTLSLPAGAPCGITNWDPL